MEASNRACFREDGIGDAIESIESDDDETPHEPLGRERFRGNWISGEQAQDKSRQPEGPRESIGRTSGSREWSLARPSPVPRR